MSFCYDLTREASAKSDAFLTSAPFLSKTCLPSPRTSDELRCVKSIRLLAFAFKDACLKLWPIFSQAWPTLVTLHLLAFASGQLFDHLQAQAFAAGREDLSFLIPLFLLGGVTEILFGTAWLVVVAAEVQRGKKASANEPTLGSDLNRGARALFSYLNATLIESVRALASVLRWTPLFLLPGLVKYIQYLFVPFVVVADPLYVKGDRDALQRSRQVAKGHLGLIFTALFLSTLIPYFLGDAVHGGNDSVFTNLGPALVWGCLTLFLNLISAVFLFSLYLSLAKEPVQNANF